MRKFVEALDHPILFVFFMTLAVFGMGNILKWAAHSTNMFGLQSAVPQ